MIAPRPPCRAAASSAPRSLARRKGRSAASTKTQRAVTSARPRRSAGTGPAPGGSSRTTSRSPPAGASPGRGGPTTTTRRAPAARTSATTETIRLRSPTRRPGLSMPPSRDPRPPARTTASAGGTPELTQRWPTEPVASQPSPEAGAADVAGRGCGNDLAADGGHGAVGLQEGRVVYAVTWKFGRDGTPPDPGQFGVCGSGAQRAAQVALGAGEQAVAHLAVGGQPHPVARTAERAGHRADDAYPGRA